MDDERYTDREAADSDTDALSDDELEVVDEGEFYTVSVESGNLIWSFLSVVFAILSVVLFSFFYIGGIISAVIAITLAVISSRKLGFFDRMALFGLIFGIFGMVFGVFSMVLDITGILDGLGI